MTLSLICDNFRPENPEREDACPTVLRNSPVGPFLFPELPESQLPSPLPPPGGTDPFVPEFGRCCNRAAHAHGPIKVQTTGPKPQFQQAEMFAKQLVWKESMISKLRAAGSYDLAAILSECHTTKIYQICKSCGKIHQFWNHCDLFWCPVCQPSLASARARTITWWANQVSQPKHVVLTVKNTPTLSSRQIHALKKSFTRLRRTKFAKEWRGGCYSIEVTNEGRGWHLHIHALIDADWIDSRELSVLWDRVSGHLGHVVKVKDVREHSYLKEVTKYAVKGSMLSTWSASDIDQFVRAFSGNRQFEVFGSLRGHRQAWRAFREAERLSLRTCDCGGTEFRYLTEQEWDAESILYDMRASPRGPPKSVEESACSQLILPNVVFSV